MLQTNQKLEMTETRLRAYGRCGSSTKAH